MGKGISVALPLTYSKQDGPWAANKTFVDACKQNLKNLFLTNKGERVMDPGFGVGLKQFLFEPINSDIFEAIKEEGYVQVGRYMPFIDLLDFKFVTNDDNLEIPPNTVHVIVRYSVVPMDVIDQLFIEVSQI